jgi:hypothetical protein
MQALAEFVMLGRSHAAIIATITAVLALILPAMGVISSAIIALVTLRVGLLDGLIVTLVSSSASALLTQMIFGTALPALVFWVILWLPMLALGSLLRASRSLSLAIQVGLGTGGLFILLLYVTLDDPQALWSGVLQTFATELTQSGFLDANENPNLVQVLTLGLLEFWLRVFTYK